MTAARIQRSRARGWKMPDGALYVGRGSMWGNPFAAPDPALAARMFRCWLTGSVRSPALLDCRKVLPGPLDERRRGILAEIGMLRGRTLACWCRPGQPCHADVLTELADHQGAAP